MEYAQICEAPPVQEARNKVTTEASPEAAVIWIMILDDFFEEYQDSEETTELGIEVDTEYTPEQVSNALAELIKRQFFVKTNAEYPRYIINWPFFPELNEIKIWCQET